MNEIIKNDPVLSNLSYSPSFRQFLLENRTSINLAVRRKILELYHTAVSDITPTHEKRIKDDEIQEKVGPVSGSTPDILSRKILSLYSLPKADLEPYKGSTVILGYEHLRSTVKEFKQVLSSHGVSVLMLDLSVIDPDDSRKAVEGVVKGLDRNIKGFIFFPSEVSVDVTAENPAMIYENCLSQMKHVLGSAQALHPFMTEETGPIPFFGAVTFGGMSHTAGRVNPFMASIHSQYNILPLAFQKNAIVKVVDFSSEDNMSVDKSLAELTVNDRTGSVAYASGRRYVYEWVTENISNKKQKKFLIDNESVILAAGGGTGIGAECLLALAERCPCRIILAGRTGLGIHPILQPLINTELSDTDLKSIILKNMENSGQKISVSKLERYYDQILKVRAISHTIEKLKRLSTDAVYVSCDFTNQGSVEVLFDIIKNNYGRLDAVIYSAGVDKSKSLLMKDMHSFEDVLRPKMLGTLNLMKHIIKFPSMKKVVFFSSLYAWQGMQGSMDYTAGNRFMGEFDRFVPESMKDLDITTVYWAPWTGAGMAGSEYLEEYFTSHGIEMISPAQGSNVFMDVFFSRRDSIAAVMLNDKFNNIENTGLLKNVEVLKANSYLNENKEKYAFIDRIIDIKPGVSVTAVKKFSLDNDLYLHDHVFDNEPIVPGVIGMELMAEAARLLFPDKFVVSAKDICFNSPLRLKDNKPVLAVVKAEVFEKKGNTITIRSSLTEAKTDRTGKTISKDKNKFTAIIRMGNIEILRKQELIDVVGPVSGLQLFMPIDPCHDICEDVLYHFGPIMIGSLEGIMSGQQTCSSKTVFDKKPLQYFRQEIDYSINPFVIDMSLQNQLKSLIWQYSVRILPIKISQLFLSEKFLELKSFYPKTNIKCFDIKNKKGILECSIFDRDDNLVSTCTVDAFLRDKTKKGEVLLRSLTARKGYGYLNVFLKGTELALYAVEGTMSNSLIGNFPEHWKKEFSGLPNEQARLDWLASRFALNDLKERVARKYNIDNRKITIVKQKNKHFIVKKGIKVLPEMNISLSHSKGWGFAGVAFEHRRIGVDIETFEERENSFPYQFLNSNEYRIMKTFSAESAYPVSESATILFSCKEAVLKAMGASLSMGDIMVKKIDISGNTLFDIYSDGAFTHKVNVYYYVFDYKIISVCIIDK